MTATATKTKMASNVSVVASKIISLVSEDFSETMTVGQLLTMVDNIPPRLQPKLLAEGSTLSKKLAFVAGLKSLAQVDDDDLLCSAWSSGGEAKKAFPKIQVFDGVLVLSMPLAKLAREISMEGMTVRNGKVRLPLSDGTLEIPVGFDREALESATGLDFEAKDDIPGLMEALDSMILAGDYSALRIWSKPQGGGTFAKLKDEDTQAYVLTKGQISCRKIEKDGKSNIYPSCSVRAVNTDGARVGLDVTPAVTKKLFNLCESCLGFMQTVDYETMVRDPKADKDPDRQSLVEFTGEDPVIAVLTSKLVQGNKVTCSVEFALLSEMKAEAKKWDLMLARLERPTSIALLEEVATEVTYYASSTPDAPTEEEVDDAGEDEIPF